MKEIAKIQGKKVSFMPSSYESLQSLLEIFARLSGAHICIHDVSGILKQGPLALDYKYQFHSRPFCTAAKSTPRGYQLCTRCKMRANEKALAGKMLLEGCCPFGLSEIALPVLDEDKRLCIIYIGYIVLNPEESRKKRKRACRLAKVPEERLLIHLPQVQRDSSMDAYIQWAKLIESYILLLYKQARPVKNIETSDLHWAVSTLQNYIRMNYFRNISLKDVSRLYFISDKYIGRLFKKQLGCTFHEYLNEIRLENAAVLLQNTRSSVLSVAMDCGFQNVTYFNRVFMKKFQLSPTQYRNTIQEA